LIGIGKVIVALFLAFELARIGLVEIIDPGGTGSLTAWERLGPCRPRPRGSTFR
tara:strand:+ start:9346 stop:9507 length:162 start_codon:yes stop_codon:yes gene_type:complete